MPTLEPIVVNAPKEKKTYTYSENDIVDIVAQAIKQGKIEAGAGFEEVEIKIYGSDFDFSDPSSPFINNQEKATLINNLIDKVNNELKIYTGIAETPEFTYTEQGTTHTVKYYINGAYGSHTDDLDEQIGGRRMIVLGDTTYDLGLMKIGNLTSIYYEGFNQYQVEGLLTELLTNSSAYIYFKIRIEK